MWRFSEQLFWNLILLQGWCTEHDLDIITNTVGCFYQHRKVLYTSPHPVIHPNHPMIPSTNGTTVQYLSIDGLFRTCSWCQTKLDVCNLQSKRNLKAGHTDSEDESDNQNASKRQSSSLCNLYQKIVGQHKKKHLSLSQLSLQQKTELFDRNNLIVLFGNVINVKSMRAD